MTEAPTGLPAAPPLEPDAPQVVRRAGRRRRAQRRTLVAQVAATGVLAALLAVLVVAGYRTSLRITGGTAAKVTDPALPGYSAEVRPTPVDLVALTSADGALAAMVLVVGGPGGTGGTLVPVPSTLALWDFEESGPAAAYEVFRDGGIDALRLRLGADMTFGVTGALTVPTSALRVLAEAAGPVEVDLADVVQDGADDRPQTVKYPAGPLTLAPPEVEEFLSFVGYREPEPNRVVRSQLVWEALLGQLDGPEVPGLAEVGGDGDLRLVDVLGPLLEGEVDLESLPLERIPLYNAEKAVLYRVDQRAMPVWVPGVVPFPTSAFPGQRAKVRLLRGTPDAEVLRRVAPKVVEAGGEITAVGNAASFDLAASEVRYRDPEAAGAAEDVAELLGVVAVSTTDDLGGADLEVVVGADLEG